MLRMRAFLLLVTAGCNGGGSSSPHVMDRDAAVEADAGETPRPDRPGDSRVPDAPAIDRGTADRASYEAPAPYDGGTGPDRPINVDRTNPRLFNLTVKPVEADPGADKWLFDQYAYLDTRVAPRGQLVVYLGGAGSMPSRGPLAYLAPLGFHTLSPAYANDYGVDTGCASRDRDCTRKKRMEALEGIDHSPLIDVTPPNAIETRVARMLVVLQQRNPQGDWAYFLAGDRPAWDRIIIAGHSHGASSAGLIGKVRRVVRAISLSGPFDQTGTVADTWQSLPSLTPVDRFWGFTHTGEDQHVGHLRSFEAMMMPGMPTSVDGAAMPPYGGSHRLITSFAVPVGSEHGSTSLGSAAAKLGDGSLAFAPVWRLMFGL